MLTVACVLAGLAVVLGAFGAHALESWATPERQAVFETAARYQMYHALALFAVAVVKDHGGHRGLARAAAWAFIAGIVLFSGSLYLLVLTGVSPWGAVAPLGGTAFVIGWLLLAGATLRRQ